MSRRTLIAVSALVVVVLGGAAVWYFVFRDDAPPRADVDNVAADSSNDGDGEAPGSGDAPGTADGTWTVEAGDTVFVGYRVEEQFAGDTIKKTAAGRTPGVDGELVVDGDQITSATIDADLAQLTSDQDRRDSALLTRGLQTEQFPDASF
jgi:polyisoprenoid-binding protein YceI